MTQRTYASGTSVAVGRSKEQVEAELRRMGATRRAFLDDDEHGQAVVMFERDALRYRIILPLPSSQDRAFWHTPSRGYSRTREQALAAWEQACRERWRALAEYIKALRVGYEAGIIRIEEALLSAVVLPSGETVGEWVAPQLPEAYASRAMPPMLPGVRSPRLLELSAPEANR
jgi:hypothetical protein